MSEPHTPNPAGQFFRRSLMGGLLILLPLAIIGLFFKWIYETGSGLIAPFTGIFINTFGLPKPVADLVVVLILILLCFAVGNLVATRLGSWLWERFETALMGRVPGYRSVREITAQLIGKNSDSPFKRGEVARVWLYGRHVDVSVLGLVMSRHQDGILTVFVPTGPNPTTGFIYHMAPSLVELRPDIRVETFMKSVISCGVGSSALLGPSRAGSEGSGSAV